MRKTSCEIHLDEIRARLAAERAKQTEAELDAFEFKPADEPAFFKTIRFRDAEAKAAACQAEFDPLQDKRYPPYELKLEIEHLAMMLECPTRLGEIANARSWSEAPGRKPVVQVKRKKVIVAPDSNS